MSTSNNSNGNEPLHEELAQGSDPYADRMSVEGDYYPSKSTYVVGAHHDDSAESDVNPLERTVTSRCTSLTRLYSSIFPSGGVAASCYNLASATLGAGIVTVSSGFHDSGIIVSAVLLLIVGACTIYSLRLLVIARNKTGLRSYEEMARGLLGRGWDYFTAFLMFVFCWGVCIGYVISVGDMLEAFFKKPSTPEFLLTPNGKRLMIGMIWLVGMFTLSLPKEINSLRYVSLIACMFIVYFVICVIVHAATNGMRDGLRSDVNLATSGMEAVNGLTLFIFAFINQVNIHEITEECSKPTARHMTLISTITIVGITLLNFLSGLFGYLDFGEGVTGSLLLMYAPHENVYIFIAYIGICLKLIVGFAICVQPTRDAIYYCLGWGKTSDVKYWVNWIVSTLVALSALIFGLFIPKVTIVFSLLGGICGGFLGFILPAYFYIYSGGFSLAKVGIYNFIGCVILIVGGVVAVVFGTAVAIYSEMQSE